MEAYAHLKSAEELKDEGNAEFRAGRLERAVEKYKAALRKVRKDKKETDDEMESRLLSNEAICLVKLGRWEEAIRAASGAIALLEESNENKSLLVKALLFRSRAYRNSIHRGDKGVEAARHDLQRAQKLEPKNKTLFVEMGQLADASLPVGPQPVVRKAEHELLSVEEHEAKVAKKQLASALQTGLGNVYDENESLRRREETPPPAPILQPPKEWVAQRMQEALERKRAQRKYEESGLDLPKGYRETAGGGQTPAWSSSESDPVVAAELEAMAAPVRISNDDASTHITEDYNRGYREVDLSPWCARRLRSRLRPLQASLDDGTTQDRVGGVVRLTPTRAAGEAVMVRVAGRWDRAYDMTASFDFEARLGPPRTAEVEMKGKIQRIFKGVPTVRGALVVRELTHIGGPQEAVIELQWGYGADTYLHFEKDEVGMSKEHANALRALLGQKKIDGDKMSGETVQSTVVAMLQAFVDDFITEIPGEPKARTLNQIPQEAHDDCVLAALSAEYAQSMAPIDTPLWPPIAPWRWNKPKPPETELKVAKNSKMAELTGMPQTEDDEDEEEGPLGPMGDADDARGGFSHKHMEQFEALSKQGYTVLLGGKDDNESKPQAPPADQKAKGTLDYSRFDDAIDEVESSSSADEDDLDRALSELPADELEAAGGDVQVALERYRQAKLSKLDEPTQQLWKAIHELADGDFNKAQELMNDPESLQRNPRIAAIIRDHAKEEAKEKGWS